LKVFRANLYILPDRVNAEMKNKFQKVLSLFARFLKWMLPVVLILLATTLDAQQLRSKKRKKPRAAKEAAVASPKVRKAQKKKEKQDAEYRKEADKARQKANQDHLNKQSAATRERMKVSEQESSIYRKKTKEPFYKKWFRKKRR
jgi:hypothetical protein